MRAAELMRMPVYDSEGTPLGPVRDMRVVWNDVPAPPPAVPSRFEVVGLVVGGGRLARAAHAWGYAERRAAGPWLFRKLLASATRDARFVPAGAVRSWGPDVVELACRRAELRPLTEELEA